MGAEAEVPDRDIQVMDAASRAELDALRVRAYGRAADIHGDPAAIARLEQLERLARGASTVAIHAARATTERDDGSVTPRTDDESVSSVAEAVHEPGAEVGAAAADSGATQRPRSRLRTALIAGLTALVLLIGGLAVASALQRAPDQPAASLDEPSFGLAAGSVVLMKIPLDGQFGAYGTPPDSDPPEFPTNAPVRWSDSLGDYYGSELWIGGVADAARSLCIVVVHTDRPRGACQDRDRWARGALFLAVPYVAIDPARRPDGLDPSQSLGFWWAPDDALYIVRGPDSLIEGDVVEASAAPERFEAPRDALLLLQVPVEGVVGARPDRTADDLPAVPALWEVQWARSLGDHYGFELWLAAAEVDGEDRLCVVISAAAGGYVKSACGPTDGWERGGVFVSAPYSQIAPTERPNGLSEGERLGFWWTPDETVHILGGGSRPPGAFG